MKTNGSPKIEGPGEEIMETEQILSDYRDGDLDKRLRMFLAYRDLREQFSTIDDDNETSFSAGN